MNIEDEILAILENRGLVTLASLERLAFVSTYHYKGRIRLDTLVDTGRIAEAIRKMVTDGRVLSMRIRAPKANSDEVYYIHPSTTLLCLRQV